MNIELKLKFAWLPKITSNDEKIWLGWYVSAVQTRISYTYEDNIGALPEEVSEEIYSWYNPDSIGYDYDIIDAENWGVANLNRSVRFTYPWSTSC